jgi:hypothetical protein
MSIFCVTDLIDLGTDLPQFMQAGQTRKLRRPQTGGRALTKDVKVEFDPS